MPQATVEAYNAGDEIASRCNIFWNSFGEDPSVFDSELSAEFSLAPGTSRQFSLVSSRTYPQSGIYDMAAQVNCEPAGVESEVATTVVNVR
jgi:hypothetical protein